MQNLINKIEYVGTKALTDRLREIVTPTCNYYDPVITLKFPYNKSDSNTRFINLSDGNDTEIEMWADESGFIYEIDLLLYKKVNTWDGHELEKFEEGIPNFNYSQELIKNKSIHYKNNQLKLFYSESEDFLIKLCQCKLEDNTWIGIDGMYFGINKNMILTSILFKSSGLKVLKELTKQQYS